MADDIVKSTIIADDTNTNTNVINVESSQNNINKTIASHNNGENIIEMAILPVNPRTQEHQQYLLYVPVATAGGHTGISSYYDKDFIVDDKGFVKLKISCDSITTQFADVNEKLDDEIERATEAENAINEKLDNEIERATEADRNLKNELDELRIDLDLDNYYNKNETDDLFVKKEKDKQLSTNDFTNDLKIKLEGLSNYDDTDIRSKLLEIDAIAKGRAQAISYDNYMYMVNAFNALPINEYSVGQSVYIKTLYVPDLWISEVEDTSELYAYTSDEAIINLLNTQGNIRVGYYVLSPLETEKVNLDDYLNLDGIQTVSGIKTFTEQIGLLNGPEGEVDYIKHINNNFLITSHDGKSLLNIDEQLEKIYAFNRELATKEYVDEQGGGGVSDYPDLTSLPVINTNNSTTLSVNSNETIKGTLNLHKVSKTGLLSDLIEDTTHRVVTDTEKAAWNNKLGANALLGIEGDIDALKTKTLLLEDSYNELYADISDLGVNKQPTLVSGTNIKTINNESILGSGNIEIAGGSGEGVALTQNANSIISAPANFLSYSGKVVTVKAGTRVVIPNGLNADGSPNNLDYTLPADATLDLSNYAEDMRYIAVQKDGTLITLMHPYGSSNYAVFVQYSAPNTEGKQYARWFDMTNNVWKNTQDKGATWTPLYCCPVGYVSIGTGGTITGLTKHNVPTDFSFTEMDKLFTDIKYQQLNNAKQAKLVSGSNIKTVNGYSLLGSSNINLMYFSSYEKVYTDAAANTTVTVRTYENEIKVVYFWFNATTNNKNLTVKDNWTGQDIAYMANIGGYNQYHLATIFMPRNREYNFTTTIAAKYTIIKITC